MTRFKSFLIYLIFLGLMGCQSVPRFTYTVEHVDLMKFMGKWYVISARPTFLEDGAFNSVEKYDWNEEKKRIDIDFSYNQDSLDGPLKKIPQKAWVHNTKTNAHWLVSPLWPFKFDYLIIALDSNYQWTVIGVPDQKYLWIMSRSPSMAPDVLKSIVDHVNSLGYSTQNMIEVKHKN